MASLVADYGESSGESDENDEPEPKISEITGSAPQHQKEQHEQVSFFGETVDGGSNDLDSDVEDQDDTDRPPSDTGTGTGTQQTEKLPNPFMPDSRTLPSPCLSAASSEKSVNSLTSPSASSFVFVNPFEQAEQAKLGILEKHVRLTEAAPQKPASKQLCWKFKKGRCHLGGKCRFFHDMSNIVLGAGSNTDRDDSGFGSDIAAGDCNAGPGFGRGDKTFQFSGQHQGGGGGGERQIYHPAARFSSGQPLDPRVMDEDHYMAGVKGKKRYGMNDTLVPPKKALTALGELRQKERPWTAKRK